MAINDHNELHAKSAQMGQVCDKFHETLVKFIGVSSAVFWVSFVDGSVGGMCYGSRFTNPLSLAQLKVIKANIDSIIDQMSERQGFNPNQFLS